MKIIINHSYRSGTLNKYITKERTNKYIAAKMKKEETQWSEWETKYKHHKLKYPLIMTYTWHIKDKRIDPSNWAFCVKYIEDGMVRSGFLPNDGYDEIAEIRHKYVIDDEEYVQVELLEV